MPEAALSLPARQDLLSIWEFIAGDNTAAADRVLDAMFRAFERLASMPEIGARSKGPVPRLQGRRFWAVPGFPDYLIFYPPLEREGLEIVRVLKSLASRIPSFVRLRSWHRLFIARRLWTTALPKRSSD